MCFDHLFLLLVLLINFCIRSPKVLMKKLRVLLLGLKLMLGVWHFVVVEISKFEYIDVFGLCFVRVNSWESYSISGFSGSSDIASGVRTFILFLIQLPVRSDPGWSLRYRTLWVGSLRFIFTVVLSLLLARSLRFWTILAEYFW